MNTNPFARFRQTFQSGGRTFSYYSLPALGKEFGVAVDRLPVCLRIILEAVLRRCDGKMIQPADVEALLRWRARNPKPDEVAFCVARILLQDFTGVPLLVDLAAMRSTAARMGANPGIIEPLVPVDLVIDHSVQVDFWGKPDSFQKNLDMEFQRNRERYEFLKWGQQAFNSFRVVPSGIGIVHQVNMEFLARGVLTGPGEDGTMLAYPDTLVGTDSHTTMINSLGIVGWGVGGIEAEAGMLGQPLYFLAPEVVGVHMTGSLREGVTATDLALHITQMLRAARVVGKFIEFYGPGASGLSAADRAPISNMSPEYGATVGFFPIDGETLDYFRRTGRPEEQVELIRDYYRAQEMFGMGEKGQRDYTVDLDLDLGTVEPSVSGPIRPQDRIDLKDLKARFGEILTAPIEKGGYGKRDLPEAERVWVEVPVQDNVPGTPKTGSGSQEPVDADQSRAKNTSALTEFEMANNRPTPDPVEKLPKEECNDRGIVQIDHGSVLIAAITSCTNTSNPMLMLAAGLLARKAVERGLSVGTMVKTSLAPGSRVVSDYLERSGLQRYLDQLGFNLVGYGCTTCIGNSGPLSGPIEETVARRDLVAASVLSGNRNFEARIHQAIKANFLMSPPLVVAFAIAGTVNINLHEEPLGRDSSGNPVFLRDIWPTGAEIREVLSRVTDAETYRRLYRNFEEQNPAWEAIPAPSGKIFQWNPSSTYIQEPPFFENFSLDPSPIAPIENARALAIFGDSVTTDHISPAGSIKKNSPAGAYLLGNGVRLEDFNSYGSRRGNDRVMVRGTFANVRIRNLMTPGVEGGVTRNLLSPSGDVIPIFDAAMLYKEKGIPLIVFGGKEYGTGSSRDWAAKGPRLLGVRAVIAESFERIHRSNLVGVGILPCTFQEGTSAASLGLDGSETFSILGLAYDLKPKQSLRLEIVRANGAREEVPLVLRIDTPIEIEYYRHGGILPYVLKLLVTGAKR